MGAPVLGLALERRSLGAGVRAVRARLGLVLTALLFGACLIEELGEFGSVVMVGLALPFPIVEYARTAFPEEVLQRRIAMWGGLALPLCKVLVALSGRLPVLPLPALIHRLAFEGPKLALAGLVVALVARRGDAWRFATALTFVAAPLTALLVIAADDSMSLLMLMAMASAGELVFAFVDSAFEGHRRKGPSVEASVLGGLATGAPALLGPVLDRAHHREQEAVLLALTATVVGALAAPALARTERRLGKPLPSLRALCRLSLLGTLLWALQTYL